jgi:quinol monooxygenase YgiN
MFRHVVMFQWTPDSTPGQVDEFMKGLEALLEANEDVRGFRFGTDAGVADDNFDFVLVADFIDRAAYEAYEQAPEHDAFVDRHVRPLVQARAAVQHGWIE